MGLIPGGAIRFLSVLILVSIVALQWLGIRISSLFQEVTTSIKCVAFLVLVAACLLVPSGRYPSARILPSMTFSGFVIALQAIVITYGGWQSPLYFIEEDRDPARNLPRTMIGGVLSVIGIYLLVNIALLKVLPMSELSGATFPAADAARVIAGAHGRNLIILLSVISLVPLLNAVAMMGTRVIFAMGRDQLFWSRTSSLNPGGTPDTATLLTAAVAAGLIATGTFQRLIAVTSFFLAANYSLCCFALIVLRHREADLPRPYRAWGYPWSVWLVTARRYDFPGWDAGGRYVERPGSACTARRRHPRARTVQVENYSFVNSGGATWQALMIWMPSNFPLESSASLLAIHAQFFAFALLRFFGDIPVQVQPSLLRW